MSNSKLPFLEEVFDEVRAFYWGEPPVDGKERCWHEWKWYVGFSERYWYCVKCDEKDYKTEGPRR